MTTINIDQLRFIYKSKSIYFPLWVQLKQQGIIALSSISEENIAKIFEGMKKQKKLDYGFKSFCMLKYGYPLELLLIPSSEQIDQTTIKLIDTKNKVNLINLI